MRRPSGKCTITFRSRDAMGAFNKRKNSGKLDAFSIVKILRLRSILQKILPYKLLPHNVVLSLHQVDIFCCVNVAAACLLYIYIITYFTYFVHFYVILAAKSSKN